MKVTIWIPVMLCIGLRLLCLWPVWNDPEKSKWNDSRIYLQTAVNLAEGNGYSWCPDPPYHFNAIRTPGYPLFLACIFVLFGTGLLNVLVFQLALECIIVYLIFAMARQLFDTRVAFLSACFYAIESHGIIYSGSILSETLFTVLLVLFGVVLVKKRHLSLLSITLLATLWAGIALTRPVASYCLPLIAILIYLQAKETRLVKASLFTAFVLLLWAPWFLIVKQNTGYTTMSSIGSYNLYATYANAVLAKQHDLGEQEMRNRSLGALDNRVFGDCTGNYGYIGEMRTKAWSVIGENPAQYAGLHLSSTWLSIIPDVVWLLSVWDLQTADKGTLSVIRKNGLRAGIEHYFDGRYAPVLLVMPFLICWIFVLAGSVAGLYRLIKKHPFLIVTVVLIMIYFLTVPGPAAQPRFAAPLVPFLCVFAGYGWIKIREYTTKPGVTGS